MAVAKMATTGKIKVLIVDDSALIRSILKEVINSNPDMEAVGAAANPLQARDMIRTLDPDVITLDVEMPEMDGLEFLEHLKTNEMYFDIPVIMVSSLITEEYKQRAMDLGAKKYIIKSEFSQDDFQETVSKILRKEI